MIGRLAVTVVDADWLPTTAATGVVNGFDKMILPAELDMTGPGSDALGVSPDGILLPTGRPVGSLFGTLSAIISRWVCGSTGNTYKCFADYSSQHRNILFKNTKLLQK